MRISEKTDKYIVLYSHKGTAMRMKELHLYTAKTNIELSKKSQICRVHAPWFHLSNALKLKELSGIRSQVSSHPDGHSWEASSVQLLRLGTFTWRYQFAIIHWAIHSGSEHYTFLYYRSIKSSGGKKNTKPWYLCPTPRCLNNWSNHLYFLKCLRWF